MMNCQKSHFSERGPMSCPYESFSARMDGFFGEFHEEILRRVSWTPMDGPGKSSRETSSFLRYVSTIV